MLKNAQVHDGEGGRVWNVRERKGEGGLHLRVQLESSVSAAAATTLPQRNMDLLFSLCSAAHFPPKSHLKLFQFRTRDARRSQTMFSFCEGCRPKTLLFFCESCCLKIF
ncbi:uncharacterized protein [Malus domestica]|uniref:uncharacterized protein isoform X11 n=1 Tax=Malus domestica TaxID=3750 RepID=UPI0039756FAB